MPTKTVNFEIDPGDSTAQWMAVDDQDVQITNKKGSATVDDALPKHALTWWFKGDAGATIKIKGRLADNPNTVVIDVTSSVPSGEHDGGGRRRFSLKPQGK